MTEPADPRAHQLKIAVVVATTGRPEEVKDLLDRLDLQTRKPDRIVVSIAQESDASAEVRDRAEVLIGPKGASAQRNTGIAHLAGQVDIIAFLDDDYLPSLRAIGGIERAFLENPSFVGINGRLLADGVKIGGVSLADTLKMLEDFDALPEQPPRVEKFIAYMYGCNMAFRANAIGATRFDESLPLYSWQEDVDFAARLMDRGKLAVTTYFTGVHRGVSRGRTSGLRFGYSQIANPIYLMRKGTMRLDHGLPLMLRNFTMNHAKMLRPEPWVDRAGRAKGNWIAIKDLIFGGLSPKKILEL